MSNIPIEVKERLANLLTQIEKEFDQLYFKNRTLSTRVEELEARLAAKNKDGTKETVSRTTSPKTNTTNTGTACASGSNILHELPMCVNVAAAITPSIINLPKRSNIVSPATGGSASSSQYQGSRELSNLKIATKGWQSKLIKAGDDLTKKIQQSTTRGALGSSNQSKNLSEQIVNTKMIKVHADGIWDLATHRNMPGLVGTASADKTATVTDVQSGTVLQQYIGHKGSVNSINFALYQGSISLTETSSKQCNGMYALTASGDQTAHLWKISSREYFGELGYRDVNDEERIGSGDEAQLAMSKVPRKSLPSHVRTYTNTLGTPSQVFTGHTGAVTCAAFLADDVDQIVTVSHDHQTLVHDIETGKKLQSLGNQDFELTHVSSHPAQKIFTTCSRDGTFRLFDLRDAMRSVSVFQGHQDSVTSAIFAYNGTTLGNVLVSAAEDKYIKVWDTRHMRQPMTSFRLPTSVGRLAGINCVSPKRPNESYVAIPLDDKNCYIYDLKRSCYSKIPRKKNRCHRNFLTSAAWAYPPTPTYIADSITTTTPDYTLYTSSFDKHLLVWSVGCLSDKK